MFKDEIGKSIKFYVDDILVNSKRAVNYIKDLGKTFEILRHYRMRPNAAKCMSGVSSGIFLGFIVNHQEIEGNLKKL